MKPAIYEPGEKIIVVSDLTQWANHSHVKTWDEAKEISQNSEFILQANQYQADESGVLKRLIEQRCYCEGKLFILHIRLLSDEIVKSIMPAQLHNQWCARIRTNHQDMFFGFESGYTMHQAQMYSDSINKDVARLGLIKAINSNECFVARPV